MSRNVIRCQTCNKYRTGLRVILETGKRAIVCLPHGHVVVSR